MLTFRCIELSDRAWVTELLSRSGFQSCEHSFANNLAWRRIDDSMLARYKDFYICRGVEEGKPSYAMPAGSGDYREVIEELREDSKSFGVPLQLIAVNREMTEMLRGLYPGGFTEDWDIDTFDYIYLKEDLEHLAGKKYHGKRNHLAAFYKTDWSFELINKGNIDTAITLSAHLYNQGGDYDDRSKVVEQFAINVLFVNFEELGLKGGILYSDGEAVGVTIGEKLNSDTFCVHIEKARPDVRGAYQALNQQFVINAMSGCEYVNREEDLGIEGLRKAKQSYYPFKQLEKCKITFLE